MVILMVLFINSFYLNFRIILDGLETGNKVGKYN